MEYRGEDRGENRRLWKTGGGPGEVQGGGQGREQEVLEDRGRTGWSTGGRTEGRTLWRIRGRV